MKKVSPTGLKFSAAGYNSFVSVGQSAIDLQRRNGTRVRAQIPLRLTSLDPADSFSESCHTVLVNPRGCGVRSPRPLKPGSHVRVDDLPGGKTTTARVASIVAPMEGGKYWTIGIGLDCPPGNWWCLAPVPQDWTVYVTQPAS